MEYHFFIEGHPEPQARPRFSLRHGYLRVHDKKESKSFKDRVYATAQKAFMEGGQVMLNGALTMELTVYREYPSSWSRIKGELAMKGKIMPDTKPDLDNYIKIALDGIGMKDYPKIIFNNDAQIVQIIAKKRYVRLIRVEGMDIRIREYVDNEV
jgi:Holliday junction resolvase RusA-like endonuclease